MKKPILLHYLLCVNRLCAASIFQHAEEVQIPITAENQDATFICSHCQHELLSVFNNTPRSGTTSTNAQMDGLHIYIPN